MTTLFISHHSSDNDWAKAIKDDLEAPRAGEQARYEGVFLDSDCI